jgi:large subunit ribosomal protein L15
MVKLNDIKPAKGSNRTSKRLGRGSGSGTGKTAGRGSNGQGSRSGSGTKPYFEGGQTTLIRRVPKRGFTNIFRVEYQTVNICDIEKIDVSDKEIGIEWLLQHKLLHSKTKRVKILGDGDLTKAISIKAHAFSKTAREKIEKAKGKAEVITGAIA